MTLDYARMGQKLPALKRQLTRAKNSNDPVKVLAAVEDAATEFGISGWPDQWTTWNIALGDAWFDFSRSTARDDDYFGDGSIEARFRAAERRFA